MLIIYSISYMVYIFILGRKWVSKSVSLSFICFHSLLSHPLPFSGLPCPPLFYLLSSSSPYLHSLTLQLVLLIFNLRIFSSAPHASFDISPCLVFSHLLSCYDNYKQLLLFDWLGILVEKAVWLLFRFLYSIQVSRKLCDLTPFLVPHPRHKGLFLSISFSMFIWFLFCFESFLYWSKCKYH